MRPVTLYELKQTELMAYEGQEYVQRFNIGVPPIWLPDHGMACPIDKNVTSDKIPVHWIRGCGEDRYIAIAPELRTILEAPFQSKIAEEVATSNALKRRIDDFILLPWWLRLLRAWQRAL